MTMRVKDACLECGSQPFKINSHIHTGKQHHQCKSCGRQFVVDVIHRVRDEEQRTLVEEFPKLFCARAFFVGFCNTSSDKIIKFLGENDRHIE